jgi:hypothetical protein
MSLTYTWNVVNLESNTSDGIVYLAEFEVTATDGTNSTVTKQSVNFDEPAEGDTVIPYANLTESVVLGWVQDRVVTSDIETEIQGFFPADVDRQSTVTYGTPW